MIPGQLLRHCESAVKERMSPWLEISVSRLAVDLESLGGLSNLK